MSAQGPTSREASFPGLHAFTYHPPPGASANRYPRAAHPAENTGSTWPFPSRSTRRTSSPLYPSLATTWCKGARRLSGTPVATPPRCFPPNLVAMLHSFFDCLRVGAPDDVTFAAQCPLARTASETAKSFRLLSQLSLA